MQKKPSDRAKKPFGSLKEEQRLYLIACISEERYMQQKPSDRSKRLFASKKGRNKFISFLKRANSVLSYRDDPEQQKACQKLQ